MTVPPVTDRWQEETIAAELGLVGAAMSGKAATIGKFVFSLDPDVFLDPICRFIWRVLRSTTSAGIDPDPLVLLDSARDLGLTPPPAWRGTPLSALHEIACSAPPPSAIGYFVDIVGENYERRQIRSLAERIVVVADSAPLAELRALAAELAPVNR